MIQSASTAVAGQSITDLLQAYAGGKREALPEIFQIVYQQLKRIARGQLYGQRHDQTLGATALVNEAYMKFAQASSLVAENRNHFFSIAAAAMRQVVVDHARMRLAGKRASLPADVEVETCADETSDMSFLLAVDVALRRLERKSPAAAGVFTCRYFAGFSCAETAEILGISERSVERHWQQARLYLAKHV